MGRAGHCNSKLSKKYKQSNFQQVKFYKVYKFSLRYFQADQLLLDTSIKLKKLPLKYVYKANLRMNKKSVNNKCKQKV